VRLQQRFECIVWYDTVQSISFGLHLGVRQIRIGPGAGLAGDIPQAKGPPSTKTHWDGIQMPYSGWQMPEKQD